MVVSQLEYIELHLCSWILSDPEFKGKYEPISVVVKQSEHLDGFMCQIYECEVMLQCKADLSRRPVKLMVKMMKGDKEFREATKAFIQCRNEVYIYEEVIPCFRRFLEGYGSTINCDNWTPKIYKIHYGKIPGENKNII